MKKIILSCLTLFFYHVSFSQLSTTSRDPKKVHEYAEEAKKTTLYVVVDDKESEFGQALVKAFYKYWKFNKFEFITTAESGKYITDEKNSVFALSSSSVSAPQAIVFSKKGVSMGAHDREIGYGIFLGSKKAESVQDAKLAAYVVIYNDCYGSLTGMNYIKDETDANVLNALTPIAACYVLRLQQLLNDEINNIKPATYTTDKIKIKEDDGNINVHFNNVKSSVMSSKKIFALDNICDERSKEKMMTVFNMPADKITIVNAAELNKELEKQNKDDIFIYDLMATSPMGYSASGEPILWFEHDRVIYKNCPYRIKAK